MKRISFSVYGGVLGPPATDYSRPMLLLIHGLLLKPILLLQRLLLIGQAAPNSKSSTNFCLALKYRLAYTNLVDAPKHHAATNSESC